MTATLHSAATTTVSATPRSSPLPALGRVAALALFGPLLLFVHGILTWVDGLDTTRGNGSLAIAAAVALATALATLALLSTELAERTGGGPVAATSVVLTAFGAGATGAIALGRATGLLTGDLPAALAVGGPVLAGLGLAVTFARLVVLRRMPLGSLLLVGLSAALVALPLELLPLGALVLLIALGPLTRPDAVTTGTGHSTRTGSTESEHSTRTGLSVSERAAPASSAAYPSPRIQPRVQPRVTHPRHGRQPAGPRA